MDYYRKKLQVVIGGSLSILLILTGVTFHAANSRENLEVVFMDVGQGDAILIKTPYEQNILIDGGPDSSILSELGKNLAFFDKHIDLMILSHPHADHVTGLIEVVEHYKVDRFLDTGVSFYSPPYGALLETLSNRNIPIELIDSPRSIELGEDLSLEILYPTKTLTGKEIEEVNNASIVSKLVYGDICFLFMGDAEMEVEMELLERGVDLDCEVLKVGHHGSSSSSTQEFLDAVSPDYAIIQVGESNKYDHPSLRVIKRLERMEVEIYRNDTEGFVQIISNGKKMETR